MANKTFPVFDDLVEVLISNESTGGALSVVAQNTRPGGGPPPHTHYNEDEILMAMDGDFEVFLQGTWRKMICGQPQYLRRGEMHAFRNCGTTMGRIMGVATPGGLDEYLEMISPLRMPEDAEKLFDISEAYGIIYPRPGHVETIPEDELAVA